MKLLYLQTGAVLLIISLVIVEINNYKSRPHLCDTTYIMEGYDRVDLDPEIAAQFPLYKLHRYADDDDDLLPGLFQQLFAVPPIHQ